jgi:hypothetical protein
MKFTKNPELKDNILQQITKTVCEERTGIHLSDTLYCLRKAYWRRIGMTPEPTEEQIMLWVTGYAFQAYLFPSEEEMTIEVDGINCSPDIPTGIEVKSTRQSMGKFIPGEMPQWNRQILGYCKALGKLEYDLVVLFVCGDYKPPFPSLDCWHIEATQEEVDANWAAILASRKPWIPGRYQSQTKCPGSASIVSVKTCALMFLKSRQYRQGGKVDWS